MSVCNFEWELLFSIVYISWYHLKVQILYRIISSSERITFLPVDVWSVCLKQIKQMSHQRKKKRMKKMIWNNKKNILLMFLLLILHINVNMEVYCIDNLAWYNMLVFTFVLLSHGKLTYGNNLSVFFPVFFWE